MVISDYVIAEVEYKTHTEDAVLVAQDGEEFWVPRSVISYSSDKIINGFDRSNRGTGFELKLMSWFADKKGIKWRS